MEWRKIMSPENLIIMCIDCFKGGKCEEHNCKWRYECKDFRNVFSFYPYHIFNYTARDILLYLLKKENSNE